MIKRNTAVSIKNDTFLINGQPTHAGCYFQEHKIEGLLLNARVVQGVFDDLNPTTCSRWDYPDGAWDAERNTAEFIAAMPSWRAAGLLGITLNLQGGSPEGYSKEQPWHNSAFAADGSLRDDYLSRLQRILNTADELGMVVILGLFYFGQDNRLDDEQAVIAAVSNITDWLLEHAYTNVLVEIANEIDVPRYTHDIIKPQRCHELIDLVKTRSAGKLLASTSMRGGSIPPDTVINSADFLLLHGNHVDSTEQVRQMVQTCRQHASYRGQPILFNEDDHFDFDQPDNHMLAAISQYAGWGYFDYRVQNEGFREGFQSVPVDWTINSERKRSFFNLLAKITNAGS